MEIAPDLASEYREAHYGKLMVLTRRKNEPRKLEDYCRIRSVETVHPGLWITATFLDGIVDSFRPDKIRFATSEEESQAHELDNASSPASL